MWIKLKQQFLYKLQNNKHRRKEWIHQASKHQSQPASLHRQKGQEEKERQGEQSYSKTWRWSKKSWWWFGSSMSTPARILHSSKIQLWNHMSKKFSRRSLHTAKTMKKTLKFIIWLWQVKNWKITWSKGTTSRSWTRYCRFSTGATHFIIRHFIHNLTKQLPIMALLPSSRIWQPTQ